MALWWCLRPGWRTGWRTRCTSAAALVLAVCCTVLMAPAVRAASQPAEPAPLAEHAFLHAVSTTGNAHAFAADAPTLVVALPDEVARTRPGWRGPVWYRLEFDRPAADGTLLALHIPHACAALLVQLNGRTVDRSAPLGAPWDSTCIEPLLVPLPPSLVQGGRNVLELQLAGPALEDVGSRHRAMALSEVWLGPLDAMRARHARERLLKVTLPQALDASLLLAGGFMFVLGFIHRRDSHLAYFGLLCATWPLLDARVWFAGWPLAPALVEVSVNALFAAAPWAAVQFLLRHARLRRRWVDRALPLQMLAVVVTLWLAKRAGALFTVQHLWTAAFAVELTLAATLALRHHWRRRSDAAAPMSLLVAGLAAAAAIEYWAQEQATVPRIAELTRLAAAALVLGTGLALVRQQSRALQHAESSRAQLEQRVREATAEIERSYRQLSELRIEQVTERERKRIAADLHDDLGAKLLTIIHTSESDRISTLAREALEEMRLSVRGLTGRPVRLGDALGDWRAEVVSRLGQAGIEAEWDAPEDLPQTLSARAYVQTTRILREATSNIIKHSGAGFCAITGRVADGDLQIVVRDDGDGIVADEPDGRLDKGHGMATMKQRARQLQGQCLVESGPGMGTVIRLTIPLERALENPDELPIADTMNR